MALIISRPRAPPLSSDTIARGTSAAAAVDLMATVLGLTNELLLMTMDVASESSKCLEPHPSNSNVRPPTLSSKRSLPPALMWAFIASLRPAAPLSAETPIMQCPLGVSSASVVTSSVVLWIALTFGWPLNSTVSTSGVSILPHQRDEHAPH